MHAGIPADLREPGTRRGRVTCQLCGRSIEIVRLRGHLRTEHRLDTASIDAQYLAAQMEVRKSRRSRP